MNNLPTEVLLQIFQRLQSPQDLVNCAQVNRLWNNTCMNQHLWAFWCQYYWVPPPTSTASNDIPQLNENWKERGKDMFSRVWGETGKSVSAFDSLREWSLNFHHFQSIYPRVKNLAFRLSNYLRKNSPPTFMSLQPGHQSDWPQTFHHLIKLSIGHSINTTTTATPSDQNDNELLALWRDERTDALKEWMLFYHFYDGQKARMPHVDVGLFGTFHCYGQFTSLLMLPTNHIQRATFQNIDALMIAVCPRSGKYLALVINCPPNLYSFLLYNIIELDDRNMLYRSRGTFYEYLSEYVDLLEKEHIDLSSERALIMFRNSGENTSSVTTRGIQVVASAICSMEAASPAGVWIYRIRMEYVGGPDSYPTSQLFRRYWLIRYLSGHVEEVRGEAVIGEFPILSARNPLFAYCSVCTGRQLEYPLEEILTQSEIDNLLGQHSSDTHNENIITTTNDSTHHHSSSSSNSSSSCSSNSIKRKWTGQHYLGTNFDPALTMEGYFEFIPGTIEHPFHTTESPLTPQPDQMENGETNENGGGSGNRRGMFRVMVGRFVLPQSWPLNGRLDSVVDDEEQNAFMDVMDE